MLKRNNRYEALADVTKTLAQRARVGDIAARNELIKLHIPLAKHFADKFKTVSSDRDDILQDAYVGLCCAVEKYDPDRNNSFSTFAGWWIRNRIINGLRKRTKVHIPQRERAIANAVRRFIQDHAQRNDQAPTIHEVAERFGIELGYAADILFALTALSENLCMSLDDLEKYNHDYVVDGALDSRYYEGRAFARGMLNDKALFLILSEKERAVVISRFRLNEKESMSAIQLGKQFNCSRNNINLILEGALKKMRRYILRRKQTGQSDS